MRTKTMSRKANVSEEEAIIALKEAHPGAEILSFKAGTNAEGERYFTARLKLAEFPPSDDEGDKPKDEPKDEKPEGEEDKGDEGDAPDDVLDLTDEPEGDGEGEAPEPKLSEVMDYLRAIGDKLGVPAPGEAPLDDPLLGPDPDALPDSGAPIAGEPAPGGAPLPPPVPEKPKPGGMGMFSSAHPDLQKVASRRSFVVEREGAGELGNKELVKEAHEQFPGFRVAKLDRLVKADAGVAVIAMVARDTTEG